MKNQLKETIIYLKNLYKTNYTNCNHYKTIKNNIHIETSFLKNNVSEGERCFCILNDIIKYKKCPSCDENITNYFKGYGYRQYCSVKCSGKREQNITKEVVEKRKISRIKNRFDNIEKFKQIYIEKDFVLLSKNEVKELLDEKLNKNNIFYLDQLIQYKDLILSLVHYTKDIEFYLGDEISDLHIPLRIDCIKQNKSPLCECGNLRVYYDNEISDFCKKCAYKDRDRLKKIINTKREKSYNEIKKLSIENGYNVLSKKDEYVGRTYLEFLHLKCRKSFFRFVQGASTLKYYMNDFSFCPFCSETGRSKPEIEVFEFIQNNITDKIIINDRKILNGLEIDILIPSKKIGIEFNGIYWHSEATGGKDRHYHVNKTNIANENGIQLIHVFDSEWNLKQDIVKSVLLSKLGIYKKRIYARKCKVKELIDSSMKNDFLDKNHLQGKDSSKFQVGLFYEGELVSLMTFGRRQITRGEARNEMLRFCNKQNTQIVGGASKLFKFYLRNFHDGSEITTFADRRWSDGSFYEKLGFTLKHISPMNYWYFKLPEFKLHHRVNFQKHKLKDKLEIFDPNLTEWENMQNNGWDRIWDCGNFCFSYQ